MKRYAIHKTASAPASRTIGSIALAIAVTAFLAKRAGLVDADVFALSLAGAGVFALIALLLALVAFHRIWTLGGPGIPAALTGSLFAIIALFPPALVAGMLIASPGANDITTDKFDPPAVKPQTVATEQPFLSWTTSLLEEKVWPVVSQYTVSGILSRLEPGQRAADIVPRRYRIAPGRLHVAGAKALENLNWTVVDELPPDLLDAATRLQAEGSTPVLGLKFDVALRIRPDRVGALLDVRSRSRTPLRDMSTNAGQIRTVFAEIDRVLLETYGDIGRLSVEESDLEETLEPELIEAPQDLVPLPGFKPYFEEEPTPDTDGPDISDLAG